MNPVPKCPTSVSLEEHLMALMDEREARFETLLKERDRRYEDGIRLREAARDRALELAQAMLESRLDAMNEWRDSLNDVLNKAIPRTEYALQHQILSDSLDNHVKAESERAAAMSQRLDERVEKVDRVMAGYGSRQLGLMGGVAVALVLTIVDILVRSFN